MRLQAEGVATMWSHLGTTLVWNSYRAHVLIIWGSSRRETWLLARYGNNTQRAVWDCALCILLVQLLCTMRSLPACALLTKARRREEPTREV